MPMLQSAQFPWRFQTRVQTFSYPSFRRVFALEANVLENRKLTSDAGSQAEIDDQTLLSNQEKLKQDISAVKVGGALAKSTVRVRTRGQLHHVLAGVPLWLAFSSRASTRKSNAKLQDLASSCANAEADILANRAASKEAAEQGNMASLSEHPCAVA
eukprot:1475916-Amphidinium_carterae.2